MRACSRASSVLPHAKQQGQQGDGVVTRQQRQHRAGEVRRQEQQQHKREASKAKQMSKGQLKVVLIAAQQRPGSDPLAPELRGVLQLLPPHQQLGLERRNATL